MQKVLVVDTDICVGCERCALSCAFNKFKVFNPRRAAIAVIKIEPGIDSAITCQQCGTCSLVCPQKAIGWDPKVGAWMVDPAKCNGCGNCMAACPYGLVHVDPVTRKAVKCDACGVCVKYCPQGALKFVEPWQGRFYKHRYWATAFAHEAAVFARKLWWKFT